MVSPPFLGRIAVMLLASVLGACAIEASGSLDVALGEPSQEGGSAGQAGNEGVSGGGVSAGEGGGSSGEGGVGGSGEISGSSGQGGSGAGGEEGGAGQGGAGEGGVEQGGDGGQGGDGLAGEGGAGGAGAGGAAGGEGGSGGSDAGAGGEPGGSSGASGQSGAGGGVVIGSGGEICYEGGKGDKISMACPEGEVIRAITFASYGTPLGQCGAYLSDPTCDAQDAKWKIEQACLQQDICSIEVDAATFGVPCAVGALQMKIETICGKATCGDGILDSFEFCDEGGSMDVSCNKCALTCEGGFLSSDFRSCYLPGEGTATWDNARQACEKLGPACHLATIDSIGERDLIASQVEQSVWVGGRRNPSAWSTMPAYSWITGEPWKFGPTEQWSESGTGDGPKLPWDTDNNEPNGGEPCVELKVDPSLKVNHELNDTTCDQTRAWLCECEVAGLPCNHDGKIDPGEECDDGNSINGDGCSSACNAECPTAAQVGPDAEATLELPSSHSCYVLLKAGRSADEAVSACDALEQKWGGDFHLTRLDSMTEFVLLSTSIYARLGGGQSVWLDGRDASQEGSWVFESTPNKAPLPFEKNKLPWEPGEPNGKGGENCLGYWWFGGDKSAYLLADIGCNFKTRTLCERDAPKAP